MLPPCPIPSGLTDSDVAVYPSEGLSSIFLQDCAPQYTVDLFPPTVGPLLTEGPYVNGASVEATPASLEYGDGADRTITLEFDSLHIFREYADPRYNTVPFLDFEPMIGWANPYGNSGIPFGIYPDRNRPWALRKRDSSGTYGKWQLMPSGSPGPFTLTIATPACGSVVTQDRGFVFNPPPITCSFTLHWNGPVTDDLQVVFPVAYWAVQTTEYSNCAYHCLAPGGFTWLAMSVGGRTPSLAVSLSPGVSNGHVFSIDVTVKNLTTGPLTNVAFTQPGGILPNAEGKIARLTEPTPPLPAALAAGESATATVTFVAQAAGIVDVLSGARATDGDDAEQSEDAQGIVEVGKQRLTETELQRVLADGLTDSSQSVGGLMNAGQMRLGLITAWAAGPDGSDTVPPWLNVSINQAVVPPPGTVLAEPPGWKVSAARSLGMDDRAMAWLPDAPATALQAYLAYADHFAMAGGKVIDQSGNALYSGLKEAATFYGQLSSGNEEYRAAASRELNGLVSDVGVAAADTITVLGQIIALSHDDPLGGDLRTYENSPALQAFVQTSGQIIDAGLTASQNETARLVRLAKADPVAAAGQLGDLVGTTMTTVARDVAVAEVGVAGVSRLGTAIERSLPFARTGASLDGGLAALDPAAAALTTSVDGTGEVVVRQSLESLAEGSPITIEQLEALGGFYAGDAAKVQEIITDINAKYGVKIEIQCRPGNPASLEFYRNGTGVPKPEWVKPKNTEWMDVVLGAPQESLGKATVFRPVQPSAETLSKFTQAQQQTILSRYNTQLELYEDATQPGGKFAKLIADSHNPEGATVSVGSGTGKRDITGLKYSLRAVGEPGQEAFVVIDDAAGGKFVLSDADYQAVVDADTLQHLPAGVRGQLELDVMNRLGKDTVSFGGHGWSHSGFDLPSKYSKSFLQFVTEYTSPASARRTLEWFVARGDLPEWVNKISLDLALELGHSPTSAELVAALLDKFRPGNFVIKFDGTDFRVGYGAGIR